MQVLSYGYKLPQAPDKGSTFFPALEFNISRLNGHSHNGVDSPKLTSVAIQASTTAISAAGWTLFGGGLYRQLVNMPAGMLFDQHTIELRTSDGERIYLKVEKVSSTTYYVYCNDNTLALVAVYS